MKPIKVKGRKKPARIGGRGVAPKTRHFVSANGKPGCIYCRSLVTKRLGGSEGRTAIATALGGDAPESARAFRCARCFKTFVAMNDPELPNMVIA